MYFIPWNPAPKRDTPFYFIIIKQTICEISVNNAGIYFIFFAFFQAVKKYYSEYCI